VRRLGGESFRYLPLRWLFKRRKGKSKVEEKPYLWMVDFTPQRDWIERRGLLLWLAFFFSEIGAGIYLVSLFLGIRAGSLIGWLTCALLGGGLHLAYLGKPERVWRAILRPQASEISRGTILLALFLMLGAFQQASSLGFFRSLPWPINSLYFKIVMSVLGFFVITHGFMTLNVISALPFWNSATVPLLSLASGIWLGTQMVTALSLGIHQNHIFATLEPVARWSLFSYVFLAIFYLWNAKHSSLAAQESLRLLTKGELAPLFYVGVLLIDLLIPTIITILIYAEPTDLRHDLLYLRVGCAFFGDLFLRYCILKAARYFPLIGTNVISGMRRTVW
jgi:formate-dependent nitrite reductase membrane component NrfD